MRDAFKDLQGMTMDCREMCRVDASSIKAEPLLDGRMSAGRAAVTASPGQ
jgi:hypothetical protein